LVKDFFCLSLKGAFRVPFPLDFEFRTTSEDIPDFFPLELKKFFAYINDDVLTLYPAILIYQQRVGLRLPKVPNLVFVEHGHLSLYLLPINLAILIDQSFLQHQSQQLKGIAL
jgi:hypothetical protein